MGARGVSRVEERVKERVEIGYLGLELMVKFWCFKSMVDLRVKLMVKLMVELISGFNYVKLMASVWLSMVHGELFRSLIVDVR